MRPVAQVRAQVVDPEHIAALGRGRDADRFYDQVLIQLANYGEPQRDLIVQVRAPSSMRSYTTVISHVDTVAFRMPAAIALKQWRLPRALASSDPRQTTNERATLTY